MSIRVYGFWRSIASFRVRVAAVVRFPQDVNAVASLADKSGASYEGDQNLYLTPAFLPHLAAGLGIAVQQIPEVNLVGVRLRQGSADWKAFAAAARSIGGSQVFASSENVYGVHQTASSAQRGIHLVVVALVVFGVVALTAGRAVADNDKNNNTDPSVKDAVAVPIQSVTVRDASGMTADKIEEKKAKEAHERSGNDLDVATAKEEAQRDREKLLKVVFVRNGDKVRLQRVETGIADNSVIEIKSGLKAGDEVASGSYTAISRLLKDGASITIEKPKAPGAEAK